MSGDAAAFYARVSSDAQAREHTIDSQIAALKERIAADGYALEPDDAAAQWLEENDPPPKPQSPKAASKSKVLHQWRQRQQRGG